MGALILIVSLVAAFYLALAAALVVLELRAALVPDSPLTSVARRLLIIAPHSDDCVIIGAGQAMRALEHGGAVRILYLTTGVRADEGELRAAREREALAAWGELGLGPGDLVFLGYEGHTGLVEPGEIRAAIGRVRDEIARFRPDRVVVPLYEGGHYQHDAANLIAARALAASGVGAELFEAPEYNFYFSWRRTPRKIAAMLKRFVPGADTRYPAEPVDGRPVYVQPMSASELATKRRMLMHFTSQQPAALVRSGGGPDRLQRYAGHDYRRPPFDYERSFAGLVDGWKQRPLAGPLLRRLFKKTRTLHPDPECRITTLPVDAIEGGGA